jgi:hypothetical protein
MIRLTATDRKDKTVDTNFSTANYQRSPVEKIEQQSGK